MASVAAKLLDELMGKGRNYGPNEKPPEIKWDSADVCRYYLAAFCPHELFTNTKADLGICEKIHDDAFRRAYMESKHFERLGYERDLFTYGQQLVSDVERRIKKNKERLEQTSTQGQMGLSGTGTDPVSIKKEKITMLTEQINKLVKEAEDLGCKGKVDQAQGILKLCEQLREERSQAEANLEFAMANDKQMEVCEICGALLIVGDIQQRVDEHLMGKQHLGYARIRAFVEDYAEKKTALEIKRAEERERERVEREKRRQLQESSSSSSRRDRDKTADGGGGDRRRSRSRDSSNRKQHRSRSRDRSRRSRSRGGGDRSSRRSRSRSRDRKRENSRRSSRDRDRRGGGRSSRSRERSRRHSRSRDKDSKDRRGGGGRRSKSRSKSRDRERRRSRSRDRRSGRGGEVGTSRRRNSRSRSSSRSRRQQQQRSDRSRSRDRRKSTADNNDNSHNNSKGGNEFTSSAAAASKAENNGGEGGDFGGLNNSRDSGGSSHHHNNPLFNSIIEQNRDGDQENAGEGGITTRD